MMVSSVNLVMGLEESKGMIILTEMVVINVCICRVPSGPSFLPFSNLCPPFINF